jgi:archaellum component FlaF (FlaF/FlaG flagellin family)
MNFVMRATTRYDPYASYIEQFQKIKVLVNGNLVAFAESFPAFVGAFKNVRKQRLLSDSISIVIDHSVR